MPLQQQVQRSAEAEESKDDENRQVHRGPAPAD
jgi:hypothetical protein